MKTYWNTAEAPARRVRALVARAPTSEWWCAALEGQEIDAVSVQTHQGEILIDDRDGSGWTLVTRGGTIGGYRRLPDGSTIVSDR